MTDLHFCILADGRIDDYIDSQVLQRFGDFLEDLGTESQPVTISASSLAQDMLDAYRNVGNHSCPPPYSAIEKFISSQDCWFRSHGHEPYLRASFAVLNWSSQDLDVEICVETTLPQLHFENLRNVVAEGDLFDLRPTIPSDGHIMNSERFSEFYIGGEWLEWDGTGFCGRVPFMAGKYGAERLDSYTLSLELTAKVTDCYPNSVRLERIYRVVLPLTIKRQVDHCRQHTGTNPFRRGEIGLARLAARPVAETAARPVGRENESPSMEDLCKLLLRKAEEAPRPSSRLRLNPLSLARLYDAATISKYPSSDPTIEVRTVECDEPPKAETPTRCYSCAIHKRETTGQRRNGRCMACERSRSQRTDPTAMPLQSPTRDRKGTSRLEIDRWQAEIQENFRLNKGNEINGEDTVMDDSPVESEESQSGEQA